MLKKRLIGVVTVKDGIAVQSFNYKNYLPLGKPECLVENLDRWGADEIILNVIDRSRNDLGPDFKLLERVANLGIGTPLIYSGGIRNLQDGVDIIQTGADRICVDSLIYKDIRNVRKLSEVIGLQGVVASLPVGVRDGKIFFLNYLKNKRDLEGKNINKIINNSLVSEIMLIDFLSEGLSNAFNEVLIKFFDNKNLPLIVFGGITDTKQISRILDLKKVSAIAIGNSLNYQENKFQKIKGEVRKSLLRKESYQIENKIYV